MEKNKSQRNENKNVTDSHNTSVQCACFSNDTDTRSQTHITLLVDKIYPFARHFTICTVFFVVGVVHVAFALVLSGFESHQYVFRMLCR